jgi:hypothetical protein
LEEYIHLQGNESLESSQLIARICLMTDNEESLLHGTPTDELICYHGVVGWLLLHSLSTERRCVGLKNNVFWNVFMVVSLKDDFWDFVPYDSS